MDQIVAELKKIPPVSRMLTLSTVALTVPVILKMVNPMQIIYWPPLVWNKFQLWRLYTSFFLGSTNINFIFEVIMMYRMSSQLESGPYQLRSADFAWQLLFAATSIVVATRPIPSYGFLRPLLACLAYLSSSLAPPGSQTSILGLVSVPIAYFPYIMIGMDLLMIGPRGAAESVAGVVVGHMWWWGVWGGQLAGRGALSGFGRAPQWLRNVFGEGNERRRPDEPTGGNATGLRAAGIEVVPPRGVATGREGGHSWGHGRRLGT